MSDNREQTKPPMTIAAAYALAYAEAVRRTNENRAASRPTKSPEAS